MQVSWLSLLVNSLRLLDSFDFISLELLWKRKSVQVSFLSQVYGATGTLVPCWWACNNNIAIFQDSLAVLYKTKWTLTIQPNKCIPWYSTKWVKNACPHKNLHSDVYSGLINNCQNLEATVMFFSRQMEIIYIVLHPENGIFSGPKTDELWNHEKTGRNLQIPVTKWNRPIWKGYILWKPNDDILEKGKL